MRRTLLKHYTLLFYDNEEELSKFLEKQTTASESIKYVLNKVYKEIGYEDLFEYLANNDLDINFTSKKKNKSSQVKKGPSTKPKKKISKPKKKEIDLSDESLNEDLGHWAQTGKSFLD